MAAHAPAPVRSGIRTRMAPSPTGWFHVGSARTALYNYLAAKGSGGSFVLRIEDTDIERSDPRYEADIRESLAWLGIEPDESPWVGGPCGPYRQSERREFYRQAIERLLESGQAFYCFHTRTELEAERAGLVAEKKNPVHRCAFRDDPAAGARCGPGRAGESVIRFKSPDRQSVVVRDLIRGEVEFLTDLLGDFSIARAPDDPLYNFAVVVDDATMHISHVIRGEEHLSNTPRQILIGRALGLAEPAWAHLPLILAPDRSKLSKRHGATSVRELRGAGYLPEAVVNFIALLGWNPGGEREILSREELRSAFRIENVQKAGAVWNIEKLDWMNGVYIRSKTPGELAVLARPYLEAGIGDLSAAGTSFIEQAVALEQPRLKRLDEIAGATRFLFTPPSYPASLLQWKGMPLSEVREELARALDIMRRIPEDRFTAEVLEREFFAAIGSGDKGRMLWPLRAALTGQERSPGPFEIMFVLGRAKTRARLERAIQIAASTG